MVPAQDDEFRWPRRRHADNADQPTVLDVTPEVAGSSPVSRAN